MEQDGPNTKSVCFLHFGKSIQREYSAVADVIALWSVCPRERVNLSKCENIDYKNIKKKNLKCFVLQSLSNCPPFEMLTHIEV